MEFLKTTSCILKYAMRALNGTLNHIIWFKIEQVTRLTSWGHEAVYHARHAGPCVPRIFSTWAVFSKLVLVISHSFLIHFEWTKACFDPHAMNFWYVSRGQRMPKPFVRNSMEKRWYKTDFLGSLILCILWVVCASLFNTQCQDSKQALPARFLP